VPRFGIPARAGALALLAGGLLPIAGATAQRPAATVARERREYAAWLQTGATSPYAALVQRPLGPGLTLGPAAADIPLEGLPSTQVTERNRVLYLTQAGATRPLPRYRPVPVGGYRLVVSGTAGRSVLTVYAGAPRDPKPPIYYDYDPAFAVTVTLTPAPRPATRRLLAADGQEVEAFDAGTVRVALGGTTTRLQVYRIPDPTGEESDLEIYFRDDTNDGGTYPAGRFVALVPLGGARYQLDFNRARNAFCAYSTAFACPLPWRGNVLPLAVTAGERYAGGGLTPPGFKDVP